MADPVLAPFKFLRYFVKNTIVFFAILAGLSTAKDFSARVDAIRQSVYDTSWGLLALYGVYMFTALAIEQVLLRYRRAFEARRSQPAISRLRHPD